MRSESAMGRWWRTGRKGWGWDIRVVCAFSGCGWYGEGVGNVMELSVRRRGPLYVDGDVCI
jgi:hypothetical protein